MRIKYRILFGFGCDSYVKKLNKLSSQGIHLKKIWFLTVSEFEVDKIRKYNYKVIMDKKFNDEIKEYYRCSGWEIINNNNIYQIVRGSENSLPIFTDGNSEREFITKKLKYSMSKLAILLMVLITSSNLFISRLEGVMAGLFGIFIGIFIGLYGSMFCLCLYKLIIARE